MKQNLAILGGLVHSQRVLLALTQAGASREEAYRLVQSNAAKVWSGEGDFPTLLQQDPEVGKHLDKAALEACFDDAYHTKHVDHIFARVFASQE
jgi:adenylosuccinate lyase